MNRFFAVCIFLCLCHSTRAQTATVKGRLAATDTASLSIINIYPDSFPGVSVVFKAETLKGEPLWTLTKEKMLVKEDDKKCAVVSLEQLSKNKTINIGIVIDHSGSMAEDRGKLYDANGHALYSYDDQFNIIFPPGYKAPIDNAKQAVKTFVNSFNTAKDFISITGFASAVDIGTPLTKNTKLLQETTDSIQAGATTALYDALLSSIDRIKDAEGVKVLVALTDGQDNASLKKLEDVISTARTVSVPIYIIGLGDVNKDTLAYMASATNGHFYYTSSAGSLDSIYTVISKQVQAFYNLVYRSENFAAADSLRQLSLTFDVDSLYLTAGNGQVKLPQEIIQYLETKQRQKNLWIAGGIATIVLAAAGVLLYNYRKRRKPLLVITKIYPNPSKGIIHIEFNGESGVLFIMDTNSQVVKHTEISSSGQQFDLTSLKDGVYFAFIKSATTQSGTVKFIIAGN